MLEIPVGLSLKSWSAFKQRVNLRWCWLRPKVGSEGEEKRRRPPFEAALLVPNTLTAITFERSNDFLSVWEVHSSN